MTTASPSPSPWRFWLPFLVCVTGILDILSLEVTGRTPSTLELALSASGCLAGFILAVDNIKTR